MSNIQALSPEELNKAIALKSELLKVSVASSAIPAMKEIQTKRDNLIKAINEAVGQQTIPPLPELKNHKVTFVPTTNAKLKAVK